jgi:hypothetical protein
LPAATFGFQCVNMNSAGDRAEQEGTENLTNNTNHF